MGAYERTTDFLPTMKPLDSDKKVSKEVSAPVAAAQAAPEVPEKIDFSNVKTEPLFEVNTGSIESEIISL